MKKYIVSLAIALLAVVSAAPALAGNGPKNDDNDNRGGWKNHEVAPVTWPSEFDFAVQGVVTAKAADSVTITVDDNTAGWRHHRGWFKKYTPTFKEKFGSSIVVKVNADTKYTQEKNTAITLADITVGSTVNIKGNYDNSTFTASKVKVVFPHGKIMGTVTAKTDTSVTVKNTVTGETKTVTVDADSKVEINGETKAIADVQVGDKGVVKFKNKVGTLVAKVINLFR